MTEQELKDSLIAARNLGLKSDSLQVQIDLLIKFILELKTGGLQQGSEVAWPPEENLNGP